jgi:hypothetical protein
VKISADLVGLLALSFRQGLRFVNGMMLSLIKMLNSVLDLFKSAIGALVLNHSRTKSINISKYSTVPIIPTL